jgi:hypothetical protein
MDNKDREQLVAAQFSLETLKAHQTIYVRSYDLFFRVPKPFEPFVPVRELQERIGAVTGRFGKTTGVHVRRGTGHDPHPGALKYSPTEAFIDRMRQLLDRGEAETFYLATDDPGEADRLRATFPGRVRFDPKSGFDHTSIPAMHDAVVDLYCLAGTDRILGSVGSTFSKTASTIGNIPLERIRREPQSQVPPR